MKQEDKELLLRYMSMALSYDLQVKTDEDNEPYTLLSVHHNKGIALIGIDMGGVYATSKVKIDTVKPYLRPMLSMTKKEDEERILLGIWRSSQFNGCEVTRINPDTSESCNSQPFQKALNFLLRGHFDIFGLIPKGLAIEVTEENNPYSTMEE